jgi:hypothetical protein
MAISFDTNMDTCQIQDALTMAPLLAKDTTAVETIVTVDRPNPKTNVTLAASSSSDTNTDTCQIQDAPARMEAAAAATAKDMTSAFFLKKCLGVLSV